jgi:hypothetical protein
LFNKSLLSEFDIFDHDPFSNAFLAAITALSTSFFEAFSTLHISSSFDGFIVENLSPFSESTH